MSINSLFNNETTVGYCKLGGIGDSLQALFLCHGLKRKHPDSSLTLYMRDSIPLFHRDPSIDRIVVTGYCNWSELAKKESKKHNIFYDDRFTVGKYVKGELKKVYGLDRWAYRNWDQMMPLHNQNLLKMSARNLEVNLEEEDLDLTFLIQNNLLERILNDYIIIHNGKSPYRATKAYLKNKYDSLIKNIKRIYDGKIIQIGLKKEPKLKGSIDIRGLTNLEETFSLVRGARLVITQEGMLAHVAKSVKTKAIVLFGPTSIKYYGYKSNINISSGMDCEGCFYRTEDWYKRCPETNLPYCEALNKISPKNIFKIISKELKK